MYVYIYIMKRYKLKLKIYCKFLNNLIDLCILINIEYVRIKICVWLIKNKIGLMCVNVKCFIINIVIF